MGDVALALDVVTVNFLGGGTAEARVEGNNAAWHCPCGHPLPLLGRCYFQYGHDCHTPCPHCDRVYRVIGDKKKRAVSVAEIGPP